MCFYLENARYGEIYSLLHGVSYRWHIITYWEQWLPVMGWAMSTEFVLNVKQTDRGLISGTTEAYT